MTIIWQCKFSIHEFNKCKICGKPYDDVDKSSNKSKCDFWELKLSYILFATDYIDFSIPLVLISY